MTTKIETIKSAYSQLRISGLTVQPASENVETALCRLEDMMAEYDGAGVCVGYNFENEPDPNSITNVQRKYWQMMASNLAVRLIADFNKQVPQALLMQASASYSSASSSVAAERIRQVPYPSRQPIGSGNLRGGKYRRRFYPVSRLPPNECATNELIIDDINDYQESYAAYLDKDEVIESFTIEATNGLTIQASANDTPLISYRIKAVSGATEGAWQAVTIVITTDAGRVDTREINYQITGAADAIRTV